MRFLLTLLLLATPALSQTDPPTCEGCLPTSSFTVDRNLVHPAHLFSKIVNDYLNYPGGCEWEEPTLVWPHCRPCITAFECLSYCKIAIDQSSVPRSEWFDDFYIRVGVTSVPMNRIGGGLYYDQQGMAYFSPMCSKANLYADRDCSNTENHYELVGEKDGEMIKIGDIYVGCTPCIECGGYYMALNRYLGPFYVVERLAGI